MKARQLWSGQPLSWKIVGALVACTCVNPIVVSAQTTGPNAVWGLVNGSVAQVASPAFIDASVMSGNDICAQIYNALVSLPSGTLGAVIDARGISQNLECTSGTPWVPTNGTPISTPATILLPTETIKTKTTWVLPDHTRLVGTGTPSTVGNFYPTLEADDGFQAVSDGSNAIIEMGSSNLCPSGCTGISIEHLTVDAKSPSNQSNVVNGIYNAFAGDQSYINHVNFVAMDLTGLLIAPTPGGGASYSSNSGPYSNINFLPDSNLTSCSSAGCPVCANLQVQTRGLRDLTCIGEGVTGTQGAAAIYVNASNNAVENVHIESFWDGVEVGSGSENTANVANIFLSNIDGATKGSSNCGFPSITNLIHLCGSETNGRTSCGSSSVAVTDVAILGAKLNNGTSSSAVLEDDVIGSVIKSTGSSTPFTVGSYALGELVGGTSGGYSRITSSAASSTHNQGSTSIPTWAIGNGPPGTTCDLPGAIYSNPTAPTSGGSAVYVCTASGGTSLTWTPIA